MTQPEALRLADAIDPRNESELYWRDREDAAAELRRLYAVNEEMLEALKVVLDDLEYKHHARVIDVAHAAIAKVEGKT